MTNNLLPPRRKRWLVVDNNVQLGELINLWFLDLGGAAVEWFTCAAHALKTCRRDSQDIELLVTDRDLRGMSGLELAEVMRVVVPGLKVIMVTTNHDGLTPEVLDRAGIFAALAKPFPLRHLELLVSAAIGAPLLFGHRLETQRCKCAA